MRMLAGVGARFLIAAILVLAGSQINIATAQNFDDVEAYADQCTTAFTYDPKKSGNISEYALGENERAWRSCIYEKVEQQLIPKSPVPDLYRNILTEDQRMTKLIASGALSRSERAARIQTLIATIRLTEIIEAERKRESTSSLAREEQERQKLLDRLDDIRSTAASSRFL